MLFQVKWFSKKKGYGFVVDENKAEFFVHHSDIDIDGYKYLKRGELVEGNLHDMDNNKQKVVDIRSPMTGGELMCQVERRQDGPNGGDGGGGGGGES